MSDSESGPEWVLSKFRFNDPTLERKITELNSAAKRLWPHVRSHALKEQSRKSSDEAIAIAAEVWESVLRSVAKTIVRSNARTSRVRDLDAYLFGIFHHRFNRALRKERTRNAVMQQVALGTDLEKLRQVSDSNSAQDIERSVQIREAVEGMDEWSRKVWAARQYGYSWKEIAIFMGLTEAQAKLRFRYALARLREKFGL